MSEAQEYLSRIKRQDKMIDRKVDRAARLYALALKTTPTLSDTGAMGGGNQDKLSNAMDKYMDLQAEIDRDVDELIEMQGEVYGLLCQIRNQKYYDVLEMHYLQYMTFEQIGVKMGYSRRWAEKLHGRALEVFGKVLKAKK